jgi:UDP-glucose 6-dehydrogenase
VICEKIGMNVAVIGVGHWGIKHVDEYIQLGYNVIVCDKSKENINNCKDRFGTVEAKNLECSLKKFMKKNHFQWMTH